MLIKVDGKPQNFVNFKCCVEEDFLTDGKKKACYTFSSTFTLYKCALSAFVYSLIISLLYKLTRFVYCLRKRNTVFRLKSYANKQPKNENKKKKMLSKKSIPLYHLTSSILC